MRPIPEYQRKIIDSDKFFERCVITGSYGISIEHCWVYGRSQIAEIWAYVPLRRDLNTSHPPKHIKELCQLISLNRATKEELAKYPKKDWNQIHKYLKNKYAHYKSTFVSLH